MIKTCNKCGEQKEIIFFVKGKKYKDGYRNVCKRCHTDYMIIYYKENDNQRKIKNKINSGKDYNWKRHKITKEAYEEMLQKYNNKCYACKINDAINIDHNHNCCPSARSCGKCIRGILCHNCNTALGLTKDSKEILNKLIKYLEDNGA